MSSNGDFADTQYRDYNHGGKKTSLWDRVPNITNLITKNFKTQYLKMVRTRNLIDGMVIPHKDFVELRKDAENYLRVFIPLENNSASYHSDEYSVFRMQVGEVWFLNAGIVHAAANFSKDSRIFLCLDFQFDKPAKYKDIFINESSATSKTIPFVVNRNAFNLQELDNKIEQFANKMHDDNFKDIVIELSKLHFLYEVNITDCYDWLLAVAKKSENIHNVNKAIALKKYMIESRELGQRFTL